MESVACIFIKMGAILICYKDDLIGLSRTGAKLERFITPISASMKINDLGEPTKFSEIAIKRGKDDEICLTREAYRCKIIQNIWDEDRGKQWEHDKPGHYLRRLHRDRENFIRRTS